MASAVIPDGGGVYTACKLNATGTLRLIDPSLGTGPLLGYCTKYETQITWNQKGVPGANGTNGRPARTARRAKMAHLPERDERRRRRGGTEGRPVSLRRPGVRRTEG